MGSRRAPDRTEIEYFNKGHVINAADTFRFIHRIFNWPEQKTRSN